jgi:hypothetical protein
LAKEKAPPIGGALPYRLKGGLVILHDRKRYTGEMAVLLIHLQYL